MYYELVNAGFFFKANGKYYLSSTNTMVSTNRYSSYVGIADSLTGKFHDWHEALPCGGNASYFTDTQGSLWATVFGNDDAAPWREKPGIVKMLVDVNGRLKVSPDQTLPPATISGLNDNKNKVADFKLYPNPANNFLMIESPEKGVISILNISGKTIIKTNSSEGVTKLDVSSFANGFYLIKIDNNRISKTQKLSVYH